LIFLVKHISLLILPHVVRNVCIYVTYLEHEWSTEIVQVDVVGGVVSTSKVVVLMQELEGYKRTGLLAYNETFL